MASPGYKSSQTATQKVTQGNELRDCLSEISNKFPNFMDFSSPSMSLLVILLSCQAHNNRILHGMKRNSFDHAKSGFRTKDEERSQEGN